MTEPSVATGRAPMRYGLLSAIVLLAYAAIAACSLNAPFFPLDDTDELYFVRRVDSWTALLGSDFFHYFRPIKNLLFALYDALARWGASMHVVRLVPILVGAASACAVYALCRRLLHSRGWGLTATQGKRAEAISLWEEALRYEPGRLTIHHNLSLAYRKDGNLEKAERHRRLVQAARAAPR